MYQPVQITLPSEMLARLDRAVADRHTTRSAYLRELIEVALRAEEVRLMDEQVRIAYAEQPETPEELALLESSDNAEPWTEWRPKNETR